MIYKKYKKYIKLKGCIWYIYIIFIFLKWKIKMPMKSMIKKKAHEDLHDGWCMIVLKFGKMQGKKFKWSETLFLIDFGLVSIINCGAFHFASQPKERKKNDIASKHDHLF